MSILLIGAGTGEATCGILYLAGYLRRNGLEAYVRLTDHDETEVEMRRSLEALLSHLKPTVVGLSLKWFHHVSRCLKIARLIRRIDPEIQIAIGGNTASFYWKELLANPNVDHVVLGDGEVPFLALCRGDANPPNVVSRGQTTKPAELEYIQSTESAEIHYSHFDDIFLSGLDLASFSGWVAPGKGCGENCLYCSGTRGMQKATFGRAKPFLRPEASVRLDHQEIASRTWQLRYDFAGSTAAFLDSTWTGVDLSKHAVTYFLWGVPPRDLAATLSGTFERIYMVVDIGCFSESQRLETLQKGLLKPCPTNRQLFDFIDAARAYPNLELEISGIAGLPFATQKTLQQEKQLVREVLERGCMIGYQRLESQPGALVTEHPERFGMISEATTFDEFVHYFEHVDPSMRTVPMVRYADPKFEATVQRASEEVDELVWSHVEKKERLDLRGDTKLINAAVDTQSHLLGDWLGSYRAPKKLVKERVTTIRSRNGTGLSLAPTVKSDVDQSIIHGAEAELMLATLELFRKPTALHRFDKLLQDRRIDEETGQHVLDGLISSKFLAPSNGR